ncbi:hypothetical protein GOODEAATRI_031400 [Goodea atripinnis]|uniref:Secreted protein n=1 Tax=Goodea atripinnis TaxID=208336 RepID=A0ABV0PIJ7_9TELE
MDRVSFLEVIQWGATSVLLPRLLCCITFTDTQHRRDKRHHLVQGAFDSPVLPLENPGQTPRQSEKAPPNTPPLSWLSVKRLRATKQLINVPEIKHLQAQTCK